MDKLRKINWQSVFGWWLAILFVAFLSVFLVKIIFWTINTPFVSGGC